MRLNSCTNTMICASLEHDLLYLKTARLLQSAKRLIGEHRAPLQGMQQPAVLEADLEVAPDRQLGEHPLGLLHCKRALKHRPRRSQLPAADDRLQQDREPQTRTSRSHGSSCLRSSCRM